MNVTIPEGLHASLSAAKQMPAIALLVRHADRSAIPSGEHGIDAELLPLGKARAAVLRDTLARQGPRWAMASPLLRCMETARCMGLVAEPHHLLGAPGPFVIDGEAGGRAFLSEGTEAIVRKQLAGHPWPFMRSNEDGAALVVASIHRALSERRGLGICVSHDAIVMPIVAVLTGERFEHRWLSPLDGLVFCLPPGGGLGVFWEGLYHEVAL